jgi:predicted membrane-bound spermidine synthase
MKKLLFLISFLEGSALMAAEIISAKLMAPYFGNSISVWTSVFVCTLSGLALGYFYGARLSTQGNLLKKLLIVLGFSTVYFSFMSPLASFIMEQTLSLSLEVGSLISVLVFLFPLLFAFGTVSPLVIKLLTESIQEAGEKSGKVYTISTLGGILATIFFGFYFIPFLGLKLSILLSTIFIALATLICFYIFKQKENSTP